MADREKAGQVTRNESMRVKYERLDLELLLEKEKAGK